MGPPGAGKGTQAEFIAEHFAIPKISTGDIFRANVSGGTDLGRTAKKYMDAGDLVPDEVTNAMVRDRLARDDAAEGFLLDGFPRNVAQAGELDAILTDVGVGLDVVLDLEVDQDEVVRRLSGRRTCKNCGHVWHVEFDPPRTPDICDRCGGQLYLARRRPPGDRSAPARGVHRADRADDRLLRERGQLVAIDAQAPSRTSPSAPSPRSARTPGARDARSHRADRAQDARTDLR